MFWLLHSIVRSLVEVLWQYFAMILIPVVWPLFLLNQFFASGYFSNSSCRNRNSTQVSQCRKKQHQSKNYNFFNYWYLVDYQKNIVDQRYGIFNCTYTVHPCWAMFSIKLHIIGNDIDKMRMIQVSQWAAMDLLSIPSLVVLSYLCITCMFAVVNALCYILADKLGLIYNLIPVEKPDSPKPKDPFAFYTVHALTSTKLDDYVAFLSFDSNAETALIDNCANTHIWNRRHQFSDFREINKAQRGVSTIGGKPHFAEGIGDVKTSWRDDNGKIFYHMLKGVLYFSSSPVCIISTSKLSKEWGNEVDYEGAYIKPKHSYSVFKWKHKEYRRRIEHPRHCSPELAVNEGYSKFQTFCSFCFDNAHKEGNGWFSYYSVFTNDASVPESAFFKAGDTLRYSRDGFTSSCVVLEVIDPCEQSVQYKIKLKCGRVMIIEPMFLQLHSDPDIAKVLIRKNDYVNEFPNLTKDQLSYLANPTPLSADDQEFLEQPNCLNHLCRKDMHEMAE